MTLVLQFGVVGLSRLLGRGVARLLSKAPPAVCAKSTTLREDVVALGIANIKSAKGLDVDRFSTLF